MSYQERICTNCKKEFRHRISSGRAGKFCSRVCSASGRTHKITGNRYGRLLVVEQAPRKESPRVSWVCKCDCGNVITIDASSLKYGITKSCGCLNKEMASRRMKTHGFKHTRFYNIYFSIFSRCNNPNNKSFPHYGGRGIKNLWSSFEQFRDDMHESYCKHISKYGEKNTTIDRVNNNGNYSKENCRWATLIEQARNKRSSINITYLGETRCLKEWSK